VCFRMATDDNGRLEIVSVRFSKRIRGIVRKVAEARGLDESTFIRQTIHQELARLNFLTDDEKKALGISL